MWISSECRNAPCSAWLPVLCLWATISLPGVPVAPADDRPAAESELAKEQREKRLDLMRHHAKELEVVRHAGDQNERIAIHADPRETWDYFLTRREE